MPKHRNAAQQETMNVFGATHCRHFLYTHEEVSTLFPKLGKDLPEFTMLKFAEGTNIRDYEEDLCVVGLLACISQLRVVKN